MQKPFSHPLYYILKYYNIVQQIHIHVSLTSLTRLNNNNWLIHELHVKDSSISKNKALVKSVIRSDLAYYSAPTLGSSHNFLLELKNEPSSPMLII